MADGGYLSPGLCGDALELLGLGVEGEWGDVEEEAEGVDRAVGDGPRRSLHEVGLIEGGDEVCGANKVVDGLHDLVYRPTGNDMGERREMRGGRGSVDAHVGPVTDWVGGESEEGSLGVGSHLSGCVAAAEASDGQSPRVANGDGCGEEGLRCVGALDLDEETWVCDVKGGDTPGDGGKRHEPHPLQLCGNGLRGSLGGVVRGVAEGGHDGGVRREDGVDEINEV